MLRRAPPRHPRVRAVTEEASDDRAEEADAAAEEGHPGQGDRGRVRRRLAGRDPGRPVMDGAPVGPRDRARRGGQGRPEARPPREPCRVRARRRSRPDGHPGGPGGGPPPGPGAAASRAHGRVGLRLLPGHAGGDGLRPRLDPADRHRRPGQRRRPHQQLRPLRLPGASPRLRRQRLRRDPARALGVGRQAAGGQRRHRLPGQRLQRVGDPRGDDGRRPRLPPVDGPLRDHAPDRRLVRLAHRRRHPRGGRGDGTASRAAPGPAGARTSRRSSARPAGATACAPSSR